MKTDKYDHNSHSKGILAVHLIFVTRFRKKILAGDMEHVVKEILYDIANRNGWRIKAMECDIDHIHILLFYKPTENVSNIVKTLKQQSTFRMWKIFPHILRRCYWYQNTLWNKGYFYCSIGEVSQKTIEAYIRNQG